MYYTTFPEWEQGFYKACLNQPINGLFLNEIFEEYFYNAMFSRDVYPEISNLFLTVTQLLVKLIVAN